MKFFFRGSVSKRKTKTLYDHFVVRLSVRLCIRLVTSFFSGTRRGILLKCSFTGLQFLEAVKNQTSELT